MAFLTGLLRHLVAVAVLPFVMAVVIPVWLSRRYPRSSGDATTVSEFWPIVAVFAMVAGWCLLLIGLFLFVHSLRRFATDGKGTLAPWDPPRHLVVRGPYRFVRNPMISGVCLIILAESLCLRSWVLAQWAAIFLLINMIYIPLTEEPVLEQRFGDAYRTYKRNVPRFLPRFTAWNGEP